MPATVNIASNLLLGAALAMVVRHRRALIDEIFGWPLLSLLAFQAIIFTPLATFWFRFYPQWSMLYMFDPQIYNGLEQKMFVLSAIAIMANFTACCSGYWLARLGILLESPIIIGLPLLAGGIALSYLVFVYGSQLSFLGSYDQFWHGEAVPLPKTIVGISGIVLYLASFLFVLWIHTHHSDPVRDLK